MVRMLEFDELDSTNSYLASIAPDSPHGTVVRADSQTAGRGQRGNSWESDPGANILMSVLLRPHGIRPADQFAISQAVALAIVKVLTPLIPSGDVKVKWPNDIYVADGKICGILIENVVTASEIVSSIAGIGINVNQLTFRSDAPNPVSIASLTGKDYDIHQLALQVATAVVEEVDLLCRGKNPDLSSRYRTAIWRAEGYHPYFDHLRNERIEGRIVDVGADGSLTLAVHTPEAHFSDAECPDEHRSYTFKELSAIL